MSQTFFEFLEQRCRAIDSLLCVGLDPHVEDLRQPTAAAARDFCLRQIQATAPYAAAFKPNSAFFEVFGSDGIRALKDVIAAVPDGIPVILDAKRGDIGSTAQAYAKAAFSELGADAITANPYLGADAIEPFIADPNRGAFVLCKTSNSGAGDLQDQSAGSQPLYIRVASLAQQWNTRGNVGLVVGATFPQDLARVRAVAPNIWILAPGIGAQGGELDAAVGTGLRNDGLGLLVPISRGISRAEDPSKEASEYRDAINRARKSPRNIPMQHAALADDLLQLGCVQFGEFKLKSGLVSPIYLDLRRLVGDHTALQRTATAYCQVLRGLTFDRVAGIPYAALPIATAVSLNSGWPLVYPRKETKEYGTMAAIEGPFVKGETVAVIDDLITTGGSKLEAIDRFETAGLKVNDIVVLIDRQALPSPELAAKGIRLHAVFSIKQLLSYWREKQAISPLEFERAAAFVRA